MSYCLRGKKNREISIKRARTPFAGNEGNFCGGGGHLHRPFGENVKFRSDAQGSGTKNRKNEIFFYASPTNNLPQSA
jgi:hypothetical protein